MYGKDKIKNIEDAVGRNENRELTIVHRNPHPKEAPPTRVKRNQLKRKKNMKVRFLPPRHAPRASPRGSLDRYKQ